MNDEDATIHTLYRNSIINALFYFFAVVCIGLGVHFWSTWFFVHGIFFGVCLINGIGARKWL